MRNLVAVALVYGGLLLLLLGVVSLVRPVPSLKIETRRGAGAVFLAGLLMIVVGSTLPPKETRVANPQTRLDEFVPIYQFSEFHAIEVSAPKERAYEAIRQVTAREIKLLRTLTWIRRLGRSAPPGILNAPEDEPVLDVATHSGFLLLADEPGREVVIGTAVLRPRGWRPAAQPAPDVFKALHSPGFALAAMNFVIEETGPHSCRVTTETRVYATDAASERKFARYWRVIYPGSALIRRMWLQAIRRRAEGVT